ncbi:hypothetical protein ACFO25_16915 [Paenactinomyces guangxiensis]|uniref:Uncharacterized protein n=1 Tax=Paenactinomyces guangxiensis TaxID=1490290 RepID=A0A7W1WUS0_9BACL|nr:hypothetical protein [Paenactinomyces guangxiensis]MBA4496439.1 hypothetical protein [Paenactinomyces guangxiensis]MBH8593540.1 hypothetical protein [Paenactinomyces guangxiensis]
MRIVKVDEYQFLTCFKAGLWGSHNNRFKQWKSGELLVFTVDKQIAALAEVTGEPFYSEDTIWENRLYPHRIQIKFLYVLSHENRLPILGKIRDSLTNAWGTNYGIRILSQSSLPEESSKIIAHEIRKQPNSIEFYVTNLNELLQEAKLQRQNETNEKQNKVGKSRTKRNSKRKQAELVVTQTKKEELHADENGDDNTVDTVMSVETIEEESNHSKAQSMLIKIGMLTGTSVWIASNDRNRKYEGRALGDNCIDSLPNLGLNIEALNRISLIDILWIRHNAPICAFEVETTTSVYSGLLRMSDLITVVPALKIKLYIVAPKERQGKVMKELRRPTFKKIGLSDYCKFIALEDLEDLLKRIKGLAPHVQPSVIDSIAISEDSDV